MLSRAGAFGFSAPPKAVLVSRGQGRLKGARNRSPGLHFIDRKSAHCLFRKSSPHESAGNGSAQPIACCAQVSLNLESSAKKARKGKPAGGEYRHRSGGTFNADNPYGKSHKAVKAA